MIFDSTNIRTMMTCERKFFWRSVRDLVPVDEKKDDADFGAAIHAALYTWYTTGDLDATLEEFNAHWTDSVGNTLQTRERGEEMLKLYVKRYPVEPFELVDLERPFALPLNGDGACPVCAKMGVHEPWNIETHGLTTDEKFAVCPYGHRYPEDIYVGRFDAVIKWDGEYYVMDHKTTKRLDGRYFRKYRPDVQMSGYVWAASKIYNKPFKGVLINVLHYTKTKIDFIRDISAREPFEIEQFVELVGKKIRRAKELEASGGKENWQIWEPNWTQCASYYGCPFRELCLTTEPERQVSLFYKEEHWSPFNNMLEDKALKAALKRAEQQEAEKQGAIMLWDLVRGR